MMFFLQPSLFEKGDEGDMFDMSGHIDSYRFGYILSLSDGIISFKLIEFVKK